MKAFFSTKCGSHNRSRYVGHWLLHVHSRALYSSHDLHRSAAVPSICARCRASPSAGVLKPTFRASYNGAVSWSSRPLLRRLQSVAKGWRASSGGRSPLLALASQTNFRVSGLLASCVAIGDEITFPIPTEAGAQRYTSSVSLAEESRDASGGIAPRVGDDWHSFRILRFENKLELRRTCRFDQQEE
jgi:hypothetical protein